MGGGRKLRGMNKEFLEKKIVMGQSLHRKIYLKWRYPMLLKRTEKKKEEGVAVKPFLWVKLFNCH